MTKRLNEKIALITGGSRGIGRAIALAFAREGASVAINSTTHNSAAIETLRALDEHGGPHISVTADVSSAEQVREMTSQVIEKYGRIDILVNNAGVLSRHPFLELTPEEFQRIHSVNVSGAFNVAHEVAKAMAEQGGGAILNTASIASKRAYWNLAHYCSSKAALSMLTQSMALELAALKIRVNEICPGLIETDLSDPEFRKARVDVIPLKRVGTPEDLTEAAIYLCSDNAKWVTGASIVIDGGVLITP